MKTCEIDASELKAGMVVKVDGLVYYSIDHVETLDDGSVMTESHYPLAFVSLLFNPGEPVEILSY